MTFVKRILCWCMLFVPLAIQGHPQTTDSVIGHMHRAAAQYMNHVHEYWAELYTKAQLDIIKKNRGFRFIPGLFKTDKDDNRFIVETYSDLHYTAPNIYDQKIRAYTGTLPKVQEIPGVTDYLNINIYAPYLVGERLLSPLAPNSYKYYRYEIDSISYDSQQRKEYHIHFIPLNKSFQLAEGHMIVTEGLWSVRQFSFKGKMELLKFDCTIRMGDIGTDMEYLPVKNDINLSFAFAFNVMEGYYETFITYKDIRNQHNTPQDSLAKKYNLTASFALQCDKQAYTNNFRKFDSLRTQPLTLSEIQIYKRHKEKSDSSKHKEKDSVEILRKNKLGNIGEFFLTDSKWNLTENATLHNSPFINPLSFTYSKSRGFSYRQNLKVNTLLKNKQSLHIGTRLGYNFTHKEFYWDMTGEYHYLPERMGKVRIIAGNGNRIGNSRIIDELKKIPSDSIIDFDKLNLDLFQDLNLEVSNHIEIINGLSLGIGFIYHHRTPVERPEGSLQTAKSDKQLPTDIIRNQYNSFAPRVRIQWTPGLYYYMNGRQKINLKSRYPTFILDYERGMKNIFNSTGVYERIEFDMQHHIRTGLLSNLYYRVGMGLFTNQKETYFVDFVNFRRNNLHERWNDEIGGVFQALNGRWYNASPYYIKGHITYEAPFLLLRHLIKYTNHVQHERLYLNLLTMDHLGPYLEVGYGIGTFVFDMGLFLSLENFKQVGFGYKFTFELFNN